MITCGRNSVEFLNISTVVRNTSGVPIAADAAPVAYFYRVDPLSGLLALDILVGIVGAITMTALPGVTGVYSCPVEVATLEHPQYHVIITYQVSASNRIDTQGILLLDAYDIIMRDATSPLSSVAMTMVAP